MAKSKLAFFTVLVPLSCVVAQAPNNDATPRSLIDLKTRAIQALQREDALAALRFLRRVTEQNPADLHAYFLSGAAFAMGPDRLVFKEKLLSDLAAKPNPALHSMLAGFYMGLKETPDARNHIQRALALDPKNGHGWQLLALFEWQMKEFQRAAAAFIMAKRLLPRDSSLAKDLAQFETVSPVKAELPPALLRLADAERKLRLGDLAGARVAYDAALKVDPKCANCCYNLGVIASRLGDKRRAATEYRKAIALYSPEEALLRADAQNNYAAIMVELGDASAETERLVADAITIRGERPSYVNTLARTCDALKKVSCARTNYEKLLTFGGSVPAAVAKHARQRLAAITASN
ncbi:MAG: tetratricopeptide repeat protein [Deltaproteobacteria bacterium]|nr:tetratricopeptide repeat protein [Deltaproteobacteria bacterium]